MKVLKTMLRSNANIHGFTLVGYDIIIQIILSSRFRNYFRFRFYNAIYFFLETF